MNTQYKYKCYECKIEYSSEEIERKLLYLCPICGKTERNKPLKGVLQIIYEYYKISNEIDRNVFLRNRAGSFWKYPYLWPLEIHNNSFLRITSDQLEKLQLNENPISSIKFEDNKLLLFDDSRNPTLSYKDRATSLVVLKAIQLGITEIAAASTGNAGSSLAGICAKLDIKAHIFVPKTIPESKRIQIQSYGANIYLLDGSYDDAFDLCLEVSENKGWYNRNTAYNPLTIEGKKSAAYDIFISCEGNIPDYIFVPVGDGVIISGIYKGFWDLKQLGWIDKIPRLIGVQASGSDAVIRYISTNKFEFVESSSIADSICAGAPRNLFMAVNSIIESDGCALSVSDEEILISPKNSS